MEKRNRGVTSRSGASGGSNEKGNSGVGDYNICNGPSAHSSTSHNNGTNIVKGSNDVPS